MPSLSLLLSKPGGLLICLFQFMTNLKNCTHTHTHRHTHTETQAHAHTHTHTWTYLLMGLPAHVLLAHARGFDADKRPCYQELAHPVLNWSYRHVVLTVVVLLWSVVVLLGSVVLPRTTRIRSCTEHHHWSKKYAWF